MRERDELLDKVFIGKSELAFGRKRKMKPFLRFLLRFIIGVVSTAAFLVLSLWLYLVATGAVKYPRLGVEYKFHRYERSFETVYQFIDDFDLTPYENGKEPKSHLFAERNDMENSEQSYNIYSSNFRDHLSIEIDDESVSNALDVLFDQAGIAFISQFSESKDKRCVLRYKGIRRGSLLKKRRNAN